MPQQPSRPFRTLTSIETVTHCVPRLDAVVTAYRELLAFKLVDEGRIPDALCEVWDAPAMAGMPCALLQPASGAEVYLRFIETGNPGGYWPPVTQGWIATEMLATEPDELKEQLENTVFKRIGGPADLYPGPKSARAMQMAGPAGELMYFTRILPGGSRFGLKGAQSFVDRPFIMVVGCDSMQKLVDFYGDKLKQRIVESDPFTIDQMSRVLGAPPGTKYPVSLAVIPGRKFLLELEEFPAHLQRRNRPDGQLPEGLAMVSFASPELGQLDLAFRAEPRALNELPYKGRNVAVVVGPAGEWLELVAE
jgi:catechol 2,3-dioxygenase-like lactoylglutathione lyase family enzyme